MIQLPEDGRCACGSSLFTLARDYTEYCPTEKIDNQWIVCDGEMEPSAADQAVRFWCSHCGQDYLIPEGVE